MREAGQYSKRGTKAFSDTQEKRPSMNYFEKSRCLWRNTLLGKIGMQI